MTLHKSSLTLAALSATLVVLVLLLVPSPAATQGPPAPGPVAAEPPAAGVYWVRLRPPASALSDDLQAALRTLRAKGQVLDVEHMPDRVSLRVLAFPGGMEDLAVHGQVDAVEPLHPRPAASSAEPSPPDSAIQATYRISGMVRSHDGAPLQDVSVSTDWDDPDDAWASSDAGGLYQLTVGVAGTYHIGAYKFGLPSPPRQTVTVPPDAGGIDLVFPPTYTLSGVVRDQDGNPVAGASVFGGLEVGTTAADGSYTIVEGPGEHYVSAAKNGYQSPYSVLVPLPPAATGVNLLLLWEDGTIRGRIVDDRGAPVAGATVCRARPRAGSRAPTMTAPMSGG